LSTVIRPDAFPDHLAERITTHSDHQPANTRAEFVLYWMRSAVRAHENPALDVALEAGHRLGLPVFVYHALSERYPYASDRHHTFILEGARDVEAECAARGIGYAFHLERPGHRQKALKLLMARAALLVTETMPVPPLDWLTESIAESAPCPVWSVDTACVVPMPLVGTAHTRAFAYRDATASLRSERLGTPWRDVSPHTPPFVPHDLPFTPVRFVEADIAELVAACEIDHGVGPVPHTEGGTAAGYARWEAFKESGGLARYAAKRNDATIEGVSRMSAYLHYGMVSPLRLARECHALVGDGPAKYLDELLVWRELAYAFCYWHPSPTTIDAVPVWARETLTKHERDSRTVLSWEALARAQSGDALWDATQTSLLRHGELHNNVRMTWGKAIPLWSDNAEQALDRLVDLNHRYALDGRDPASYGGLLWCLGQFDRPFTPPVRILGTVRPRPTSEHLKRLDLSRYQRHVTRPRAQRVPRVLVVGAGIAGLACARTLQDHGVPVMMLDKSRGVGGRSSTRREGSWRFDHGAPEFALRDARLARYLESWEQDGVMQHNAGAWTGREGMNALARHLARGLSITTGAQVASLQRADSGWQVQDDTGRSWDADVLVLATPAPQAHALLQSAALPDSVMRGVASALESVRMTPCWSGMVVFDAPPPVQVTERLERGAEWRGSQPLLARCWRQNARPGRSGDEAWVIQASAEWSSEHLEQRAEVVAEAMATALKAELKIAGDIVHARAHRWRYARVASGVPASCLYDVESGLGAAGDFAWGPESAHRDAEAAWLSGVALAGRVLSR
jgi:photolyase PhrII